MAKKESKPKVYTCHYCKLPIEDNLVEFEMGQKTITTKRAHAKCRTNKLKRDQFYDQMFKMLDVTSKQVSERVFTAIEGYNKQYGWDTLLHALEAKRNAVIDNFDKGWFYFLGIIKNQLPFSHKIVKDKLRLQKEKEKIKLQKQQSNDNIIKVKPSQPTTQVIELDNIAAL
jgi:hypothetical protein